MYTCIIIEKLSLPRYTGSEMRFPAKGCFEFREGKEEKEEK